MSLINLLANALLHEMLSQGRQRIHQIADLYQQLDELEHRKGHHFGALHLLIASANGVIPVMMRPNRLKSSA